MVFKFATFDPAQDPDAFNPAFPPSPSSSPSVTLCQPCEYTYTFTKTIVSRLVAAGASLVFKAPAFELDGHETQDRPAEVPLHSINFVVRPEFHQRPLQEFTLKELEVATRNFRHDKLIAKGGFGDVYEGRLADGSAVAIKRWNKGIQGIKEFESEVMIGRMVPPHHNLLPMLGFCRTTECEDLLLVAPFKINRSAAWCLRERPAAQTLLDWPTRIKIATGAARGLSHLHDLNIVHRDIKAANVMLGEEFEPQIGDFGLAKVIDSRHGGYSEAWIAEAPALPGSECEAGSNCEYLEVTTSVCGTLGHVAPEYLHTGKCSVKNDVFGFGAMLLELVTGRKAADLERRKNGTRELLLDWVKARSLEVIVDPNLQGEYDKGEMKKVIQLALLCSQNIPTKRPSMAQVVRTLEGHMDPGEIGEVSFEGSAFLAKIRKSWRDLLLATQS